MVTKEEALQIYNELNGTNHSTINDLGKALVKHALVCAVTQKRYQTEAKQVDIETEGW